ncbi:hypothetical protein [Roseicella aquatilis]|uniref:Uncharacterized protein n=1 Tax=Roseicella aquatilis TaxID=2527868 RepID=A0A4R4D4H8_9PROT|nr:hypothetical protein [Roseicella aquatilis]TCZ53411.1 hypothetical protein EXY23_24790 [Roseicella aquatilis]
MALTATVLLPGVALAWPVLLGNQPPVVARLALFALALAWVGCLGSAMGAGLGTLLAPENAVL